MLCDDVTELSGEGTGYLHLFAMSTDSSYSFSLTTFSRTGKLIQIEHALSAAQQGKASLGIRGESTCMVSHSSMLYQD